jgi:hypothetical protein
MAAPLYILRTPADRISPSLYPPDDSSLLVLGIEGAVSTVIPAQPAEVLQWADESHLRTGERLTYKRLLDVIVQARNVMTL